MSFESEDKALEKLEHVARLGLQNIAVVAVEDGINCNVFNRPDARVRTAPTYLFLVTAYCTHAKMRRSAALHANS